MPFKICLFFILINDGQHSGDFLSQFASFFDIFGLATLPFEMALPEVLTEARKLFFCLPSGQTLYIFFFLNLGHCKYFIILEKFEKQENIKSLSGAELKKKLSDL